MEDQKTDPVPEPAPEPASEPPASIDTPALTEPAEPLPASPPEPPAEEAPTPQAAESQPEPEQESLAGDAPAPAPAPAEVTLRNPAPVPGAVPGAAEPPNPGVPAHSARVDSEKGNAAKKRKAENHLNQILTLTKEKGSIANRDVVKTIYVSPATAGRYLNALVIRSKLRREGKGRSIRYSIV